MELTPKIICLQKSEWFDEIQQKQEGKIHNQRADLEFVATVATGGRVKFLSAV